MEVCDIIEVLRILTKSVHTTLHEKLQIKKNTYETGATIVDIKPKKHVTKISIQFNVSGQCLIAIHWIFYTIHLNQDNN